MTIADRITVRLSASLLARLDAYCAREKKRTGYPVTRADAVRALIEGAAK
ncbi:MAG: hypothetical protein WC211_00880 [Dehalococcoidia bacterium]